MGKRVRRQSNLPQDLPHCCLYHRMCGTTQGGVVAPYLADRKCLALRTLACINALGFCRPTCPPCHQLNESLTFFTRTAMHWFACKGPSGPNCASKYDSCCALSSILCWSRISFHCSTVNVVVAHAGIIPELQDGLLRVSNAGGGAVLGWLGMRGITTRGCGGSYIIGCALFGARVCRIARYKIYTMLLACV